MPICYLYIAVYQHIRYLRELLEADFVVNKAKVAEVLKVTGHIGLQNPKNANRSTEILQNMYTLCGK